MGGTGLTYTVTAGRGRGNQKARRQQVQQTQQRILSNANRPQTPSVLPAGGSAARGTFSSPPLMMKMMATLPRRRLHIHTGGAQGGRGRGAAQDSRYVFPLQLIDVDDDDDH